MSFGARVNSVELVPIHMPINSGPQLGFHSRWSRPLFMHRLTQTELNDEKHKDQIHFLSMEQSRQRATGDTNTQPKFQTEQCSTLSHTQF